MARVITCETTVQFSFLLPLVPHTDTEVHQDLSHFRSGGKAAGGQNAAAPSADKSCPHCPGHRLCRPGGDILSEGRQQAPLVRCGPDDMAQAIPQ